MYSSAMTSSIIVWKWICNICTKTMWPASITGLPRFCWCWTLLWTPSTLWNLLCAIWFCFVMCHHHWYWPLRVVYMISVYNCSSNGSFLLARFHKVNLLLCVAKVSIDLIAGYVHMASCGHGQLRWVSTVWVFSVFSSFDLQDFIALYYCTDLTLK